MTIRCVRGSRTRVIVEAHESYNQKHSISCEGAFAAALAQPCKRSFLKRPDFKFEELSFMQIPENRGAFRIGTPRGHSS
jgi:hypothetical protein